MRKLTAKFLPGKKKAAPRKRRRTRRPDRRRALGLFLTTMLFGVLLGFGWAWWSGWAMTARAELASWAVEKSIASGLVVRKIEIEGYAETRRKTILGALGVQAGDPILSLDPAKAQAALEALPWVQTAAVERHLPDRIHLRLTEREPLALWQNNGKLALIDVEGVVIQRSKLARFRTLPVVIGGSAPKKAQALFATLGREPELAARVATATLIGRRRWNLRLKNGVEIYLPEEGLATAWATLSEYDRLEGITQHKVTVVDLRLEGRLVVRIPQIKTKPGHRPERET
ncbi:FtsQ-type POTRA domain-containing protein [Rhodospirillaceae bacterium AH-315-P19]|nr:FtsQ-type POTRA domain-containing protein [Rhodospirillaceae bacterium AH-315-P19]